MCVIFLNEWLESFDINVTDEKTVLQTSEPLESQPNLAQQQKSLLIHIWNSTKAPVFVLRVFLMRSWRMQWCNSELLSKLYIYIYYIYIYIYLYSHTHVCCPDIHDASPSTSTYVTLEICRCQTCGSWHFNSATSVRSVSFAWPLLHAVTVCRTNSGVCLQSVMGLVAPESHMRCATFGDCLQSFKPLTIFPVGFLELTARPSKRCHFNT